MKWRIINRMLRLIGLVIGVILFMWFCLPYFGGRVLNIGNITGILVSIVFMVYMAFMPVIHKYVAIGWNTTKWRMPIGIAGGVISAIVIIVAIETGCIISACNKAPTENATAVVLGCRVYSERASRSLVERLEAAYEYLTKYPEAMCVVAGGQGEGEDISEAECMKRWLVEKGIEESRIYKEDKSTSTEENIAFSKKVIEDNQLKQEIAIVTSEYHAYRASLIAKEENLSYGTVPGKTAWWLLPTFYVRELYGILAEWIFKMVEKIEK